MINQNKPVIIILDGHDGAGKTTLATLLSKELNAKYIKPFSDSLGDLIAWAYRRKDFDFANEIALSAIQRQIEINYYAKYLVFDRHWMSLFTVLPSQYYSSWFPLPFTFLCWADVPTTTNRLETKSEKELYPGYHEYYCKKYKEIAASFRIPIVDTSGEARAENKLSDIMSVLRKNKIVEYNLNGKLLKIETTRKLRK